MIESKPITPAQPSDKSYPISALNLFRDFSRPTYLATFGEEAPNWDKARQIKRWFDSTALPVGSNPNEVMPPYLGWDSVRREFVHFSLTRLEASQVNLPGFRVLPKFEEAPTDAMVVGPYGLNGSVAVNSICAEADARKVMEEVGGTNLRMATTFMGGGPFFIVWGSETRRQWMLTWKGNDIQCESLIRMRNAQGVGGPGVWNLDGSFPVWVPADLRDSGETDNRPEVLMPVRGLLPNEQLNAMPVGNPSVIRVDLSGDQPAPGTGALTAIQNMMLKAINEGVIALRNKAGV
jgi:hypothetical protein